ncbi:organic cation transporter protein-like [Diorhabda sublineata]|uniref:organic cation transporter protein-like n=1 Tax=Diorhabda sublineata TaxID=1163346 RepID=UPI0024E0EA61|nr:organic cation transporter protein-like [Diorhabda sublineata]
MEITDHVENILKGVNKFGKYQIFAYLSLGFVYMFNIFDLGYIFIARDAKYRCFIPECEADSRSVYNPEWLKDFVPFKGGSPDSCHRYAMMNNTCSVTDISRNETQACEQFVYQTHDITIVHDFGIHCEENVWKLTIVGTVSMCGELVGLSYSGFISDRYGRKTILIAGVLLSTLCGILKSLSVSYTMYVIMEFLDPALGAGMYNAAFILAMEFVAPKHRNFANTVICCLVASSQCILALTAWLTTSWRIMLRILYIPGFIAITFFWTIPESIRWLLSKNKIEEIQIIVSRLQGKETLSENTTLLTFFHSYAEKRPIVTEKQSETFIDAVKSRILLLRLIHCAFTWICCTFLYFGLTMNSVTLSEDVYSSFILSALVEIPGYLIYYYGNLKIGRRLFLSITFISAGVSCLAVGFIPKDLHWLKLTLYLVGKCSATISYTVIYVYTTEMFPTTCRHSTLSVCSMLGRFGSMVAPQIPFMARMYEILPLILFAIIGSTSGTLALLFPETLNTKLPETIQEAIDIGKNQKRNI